MTVVFPSVRIDSVVLGAGPNAGENSGEVEKTWYWKAANADSVRARYAYAEPENEKGTVEVVYKPQYSYTHGNRFVLYFQADTGTNLGAAIFQKDIEGWQLKSVEYNALTDAHVNGTLATIEYIGYGGKNGEKRYTVVSLQESSSETGRYRCPETQVALFNDQGKQMPVPVDFTYTREEEGPAEANVRDQLLENVEGDDYAGFNNMELELQYVYNNQNRITQLRWLKKQPQAPEKKEVALIGDVFQKCMLDVAPRGLWRDYVNQKSYYFTGRDHEILAQASLAEADQVEREGHDISAAREAQAQAARGQNSRMRERSSLLSTCNACGGDGYVEGGMGAQVPCSQCAELRQSIILGL